MTYAYAETVNCLCFGLKPNTQHRIFYQGIDLSGGCIPIQRGRDFYTAFNYAKQASGGVHVANIPDDIRIHESILFFGSLSGTNGWQTVVDGTLGQPLITGPDGFGAFVLWNWPGRPGVTGKYLTQALYNDTGGHGYNIVVKNDAGDSQASINAGQIYPLFISPQFALGPTVVFN